MNLKDFEGPTYKVIVMCLLGKAIARGGNASTHHSKLNSTRGGHI